MPLSGKRVPGLTEVGPACPKTPLAPSIAVPLALIFKVNSLVITSDQRFADYLKISICVADKPPWNSTLIEYFDF